MRYVFKAKTKSAIRITANNQKEAEKEFLEQYIIINREKTEVTQ